METEENSNTQGCIRIVQNQVVTALRTSLEENAAAVDQESYLSFIPLAFSFTVQEFPILCTSLVTPSSGIYSTFMMLVVRMSAAAPPHTWCDSGFGTAVLETRCECEGSPGTGAEAGGEQRGVL